MNQSKNQSTSYKDRRTGLVVFGVLEILAGVLISLMIPLMFLAQFAQTHEKGVAMDYGLLSLLTGWYGAWALVLFCLGIGSIRARRWARALSLILAWLGLVLGLLFIGITALMWPYIYKTSVTSPGFPDVARGWAMVVGLCIMLVFGLLWFAGIPLIGVLFYGSKHVKATCEAKSPAAWTDACPLPVLAVSVYITILSVFVLCVFFSQALFVSKIPILQDAVSMLIVLAFVVLYLFSAWKMYRLAIIGWWIQMIAVLIGIAVIVMCWIESEPPLEAQAMMTSTGLLPSPFLVGLIPGLLWLGYLFWIVRFFNRKGPAKAPELPVANNLG